MNVTLLTGFLGTGKTTSVQRILAEHGSRRRLGVIVNDLSDLEVDGELIRLGDRVSEKDGTLASLTAGSISHGLRGDLSAALGKMAAAGVEHVIVEASGASNPIPIIETIQATSHTLGAVVALVDARALLRDFGGGPGLSRSLEAIEATGESSHEVLLVSQIRVATVVALSKIDLVPEDALPQLLRNTQHFNPRATLTACVFGKLDAALIFGAPPYSRGDHAILPKGDAHDFDIGTTVLRDARPFHPRRFYDLYSERLGLGIFRSKGFLWFASRPSDVLVWNQAGGVLGLEFLGTWRAAILAEGNLLPEERIHLETLLANAHPLFGDRGCEVTIIGREADRAIFCREMEACFCTPEEIDRYLAGKPFEDPWPKNIRAI